MGAARREEEHGYALYATQAIQAGEVIERYEEQPHPLVSKTHILKHWESVQKHWFPRYAYPLTDEVWVMWSEDPMQWKPINHSCDPNAWLEGLDVVARRTILPGEEITLDYATFCHETMPEFVCQCGSATCRGVIRGTDSLRPLVQRYGDHISDYVRMKRQGMKEADCLAS